MTTTAFVLIGMVALPLGWEVLTLVSSDLKTISATWKMLGQEWSPFFIYGVSVLVGHFWVSPPEEWTLAGRLSETAEVAVVLWVGWGLFGFFRANGELMPLPWHWSLALIAASVLIGAFAWTIGA